MALFVSIFCTKTKFYRIFTIFSVFIATCIMLSKSLCMYHSELYWTFTFSNAYPRCTKSNEDSDQKFDILIIVTKSTFRSIKKSLNREKVNLYKVCTVFENTDPEYIVHPEEFYRISSMQIFWNQVYAISSKT